MGISSHDARKSRMSLYFTREMFLWLLMLMALTTPANARPKKGFSETPSTEGAALFNLRSGYQRLSSGDARGAVELLTRALDSGALPDVARGSGLFFRGAAYREEGKFSESLADLDAAEILTPEKGQIPVLAFDVALRMDQTAKAYDKALRVAKNFPLEVSGLSLSALTRVVASLDKGKRLEDAHNLRAALFNANYHGNPVGTTADYLYKELVVDYLDRNDIINAIRVAGQINTVDVILDMSIDARFQEVWQAVLAGAGGSLRVAAERQKARFEIIVTANPGDNQAVHGLIDALRFTGQPAKAIAIGDIFLKDPIALGRDPDGYFWVLTATSYAEVEAGNRDAGIKRIAELTSYKLDDYPDLITQHINRASMLLDQGRFEEASAAAHKADSRYESTYAKLWVVAIDVCSNPPRKDNKNPDPLLDSLRTSSKENPQALALALLCANKIPEVEQWYIKRLNDPEMRSDALQALQNFTMTGNEGSHFTTIQERLNILRKKSSIRKAISKVGRQLDVDLPRSAFVGY